MTSPVIRSAQEGDADGLVPLRLAYYRSQRDLGLLDWPADVSAHVDKTTPGVLKSARARVLVAERDAKLVGYAIASFRVVPGVSLPSVCSVDEVFVSHQCRGTGMARRLVENLLEHAALRQADRIQIRVLSGNPKARALWERLGFVENVVILEYAGPAPRQESGTMRGDEA